MNYLVFHGFSASSAVPPLLSICALDCTVPILLVYCWILLSETESLIMSHHLISALHDVLFIPSILYAHLSHLSEVVTKFEQCVLAMIIIYYDHLG